MKYEAIMRQKKEQLREMRGPLGLGVNQSQGLSSNKSESFNDSYGLQVRNLSMKAESKPQEISDLKNKIKERHQNIVKMDKDYMNAISRGSERSSIENNLQSEPHISDMQIVGDSKQLNADLNY